MRVLLICVLCFLVGCQRSNEPDSKPFDVHIESLYRVHRDAPELASHTWGKRRVRIRLQARDYQVNKFDIHWHDSMPNEAAVIVFHCDRPLLDNSREIEIVGTCFGIQKDGIQRPNDINWHVRCDECIVTLR